MVEGYDLLIRDIDAIAEQLKRLQDAGVPVLWRPLHEASGGWFWWGNAGAEAYKELYVLLYDRLTNHHDRGNRKTTQKPDNIEQDQMADLIKKLIKRTIR